MFPFRRTGFIPEDPLFGIDSVQGLLELATWYNGRRVFLHFDLEDKDSYESPYFQLLQLEKEGYINALWEPHPDDGREMVKLKQISLTTNGHRLLDELQQKSSSKRLRKRLGDLFWAALTSIVTTLIVLKLKGI